MLAEELGEKVDDSHKLKDLKRMILARKEYDEECTREWLIMIINERKEEIQKTDQLKRKVSQEVKDHIIVDWSKLNSPDDLVEKLDNYDTSRSTIRSKQLRKEGHYDKRNSFKYDPAVTTNEKRKMHGITHNERGEPK
ncbi:hypothetical protein AVEN_11302-1 [Araneus ventricosus]|uniref:Uncharacterized protein n=1 Tax=Araneus ventricosus TaxID=182803 RepID=A0A4Y2DYR3_ARAVE|nr:hypothetical protein AVEN_11302-1 [Araneus ventricosus]